MKTLKTRKNILLVTLIIGLVIGLTALSGQSRNNSARKVSQRKTDRKAERNPMPVINYAAPRNANEDDSTLRQIRGKRYDHRGLVNEEAESESVDRTTHWWRGLSALPVAQSDAVLLGRVKNAQAYLSNDRTGVYSEFTIRIDQVFKNNEGMKLSLGDSVILEREGGAVQFPSGRTQRYSLTGQEMPAIGQRYVFFLKHNKQEQNFSILTAYEMQNSRVVPLDSVDVFTPYENANPNTFMTRLNESIASHQQTLKQGKEPK